MKGGFQDPEREDYEFFYEDYGYAETHRGAVQETEVSTMPHIKQLLIEQINEYDKQAGESCQALVTARLADKTEPSYAKARMISCIASSQALRHFGQISGLLEKCKRIADTARNKL